ncbi:hypothetical protein C0995_007513 [Termitomyces sp. Mi166|nr:hypothetical protein C0995_007513 [Termitomyces sp. Mi166\
MSVIRAGKSEPLQEYEAVLNVQYLLDDGGKNWYHHIERLIMKLLRLVSSTALTAAFGLRCPTGYEPELKEIYASLDGIVSLSLPTSSITNFFPFLDLIPGPMPWRIRARSFVEKDEVLYGKLVDQAMRCKSSGIDTWAATFVGEDQPEGDQRGLLKQFAAITSALRSFVLACILHPEWIVVAQKEIDDVVGPDRLPSFKDRPFLPYIEAVVRETLRWRPADHIKQANLLRAIEHDQSKFEDHDRFKPERFLDSRGKLKPNYETSAFGFGRRVCPGVPFAERSLWIDIATMLWAFNIRASDEVDSSTGRPFQYDGGDAAFTGVVSY